MLSYKRLLNLPGRPVRVFECVEFFKPGKTIWGQTHGSQ